MEEFTFTDEEFSYLGFYLFVIDSDDPEDWEEFDFGKELLNLYHTLHEIYLEREKLLTLEGKSVDSVLDKRWKISFTEKQIDIITDENEDALRIVIDDPEFESYLGQGNQLLKIFSKPPLSLADLKDDNPV